MPTSQFSSVDLFSTSSAQRARRGASRAAETANLAGCCEDFAGALERVKQKIDQSRREASGPSSGAGEPASSSSSRQDAEAPEAARADAQASTPATGETTDAPVARDEGAPADDAGAPHETDPEAAQTEDAAVLASVVVQPNPMQQTTGATNAADTAVAAGDDDASLPESRSTARPAHAPGAAAGTHPGPQAPAAEAARTGAPAVDALAPADDADGPNANDRPTAPAPAQAGLAEASPGAAEDGGAGAGGDAQQRTPERSLTGAETAQDQPASIEQSGGGVPGSHASQAATAVASSASAATDALAPAAQQPAPAATQPPAPATPAPPPVPMTPHEFAEANNPRIVTSVRGQLLPNGGQMQIRLDPPELGALQVMVRMQDGAMTASFETSNPDATRLLSHSLNQLKSALESQGVTVEKLQVQQSPRDQQAGNDNGRQDQQGRPDDHPARQEQQRREMLRRMWRRLSMGEDPLDLVA